MSRHVQHGLKDICTRHHGLVTNRNEFFSSHRPRTHNQKRGRHWIVVGHGSVYGQRPVEQVDPLHRDPQQSVCGDQSVSHQMNRRPGTTGNLGAVRWRVGRRQAQGRRPQSADRQHAQGMNEGIAEGVRNHGSSPHPAAMQHGSRLPHRLIDLRISQHTASGDQCRRFRVFAGKPFDFEHEVRHRGIKAFCVDVEASRASMNIDATLKPVWSKIS